MNPTQGKHMTNASPSLDILRAASVRADRRVTQAGSSGATRALAAAVWALLDPAFSAAASDWLSSLITSGMGSVPAEWDHDADDITAPLKDVARSESGAAAELHHRLHSAAAYHVRAVALGLVAEIYHRVACAAGWQAGLAHRYAHTVVSGDKDYALQVAARQDAAADILRVSAEWAKVYADKAEKAARHAAEVYANEQSAHLSDGVE